MHVGNEAPFLHACGQWGSPPTGERVAAPRPHVAPVPLKRTRGHEIEIINELQPRRHRRRELATEAAMAAEGAH